MRNTIFIFMLVAITVKVKSQINNSYNTVISDYLVFTGNESRLIFSANNETADWSIYVDTEYGVNKYYEIRNSSAFVFFPDMLDIDWHYANRYTFDGDNSTYFKGFLVCKQGNQKDTTNILFNLLPAKPEILEVNLTYDGFDFTSLFMINPKGEIIIKSPRNEECHKSTSEWGLTQQDRNDNLNFFTGLTYKDYEKNNDGIFKFPLDWEWGEYFYFVTENKYGGSQPSDTLFTTDYIKDPLILDAINNATSINDIKAKNNSPIQIQNHFLFVNVDTKSITINKISGQCVLRANNINKVDVSSLEKGIYIIRVLTDKGKKITKKIIL